MPITRVLKVDPEHPQSKPLAEAAEILRQGGLVAFPTETVYGLGANAREPRAVERIFSAKGRPPTDPLIVHIASIDDLANVAINIPKAAELLAEKFWPGPLTLVLTRSEIIADNVSGGLPTVGVRFPAHPIARLLIQTAGVPVAAPSANLFSHTSPTEARHVLEDLDGRVDIILDGGKSPIGVESTVLNLMEDPPEILRPGGVSLEALRIYLPMIRNRPNTAASETESTLSPGMLLKHYAPLTPLQVISGPLVAIRAFLDDLATMASSNQERIGLLLTDEIADACAVCRSENVVVVRLGPGTSLDTIAAHLFAALRSLDQAGVNRIIAIEPERLLQQGGLAPAIHDRLVRASSGNFIHLGENTDQR